MKATLLSLLEHLRDRRFDIVRRASITYEVHDPTYGSRMCSDDIEVVDFDALLDAIDDFARGFSKETK